MKMTRPQRLAIADLDLALEEALNRVKQAREMTAEECAEVTGGVQWDDQSDISGRR